MYRNYRIEVICCLLSFDRSTSDEFIFSPSSFWELKNPLILVRSSEIVMFSIDFRRNWKSDSG